MAMTAAEKSFKQRVKGATAPIGYMHYWPGEPRDEDGLVEGVVVRHWGQSVSLGSYEEAFRMYGTYLELIGGDKPVEHHVSYVFPAPSDEAAESITDLHHVGEDGPRDES